MASVGVGVSKLIGPIDMDRRLAPRPREIIAARTLMIPASAPIVAVMISGLDLSLIFVTLL